MHSGNGISLLKLLIILFIEKECRLKDIRDKVNLTYTFKNNTHIIIEGHHPTIEKISQPICIPNLKPR